MLKIEAGTTLKILKLLCSSGTISLSNILGVKPIREDGDTIPCVVTLDESILCESSYELILIGKLLL